MRSQSCLKSALRKTERCTCALSIGEKLIYHALRSGGERLAQLAEDALRALPLQIVEANKDLTLHAARLKANHKMSYADCFAAALAMKNKCELITGDKEFKQVEGAIKIKWM